MPRRSGDGLSNPRATCLAGVALLAFVAACQADVGDAGCQLTTTVVLPGSPLTLLPDVRLEPVGAGFVLIGSDGAVVRWASLTDAGVLGPEHALPLPSGVSAPRFALAGTTAPATHVLVSYVTAAANGVDAELHVVSAAADGSDVGQPGPALVTFVGGTTAGPSLIEMGTSRNGMTAGLAWLDTQAAAIRFVSLDGAGQMLGEPTASDPAVSFACLGFSAGKGDKITFKYERTLADDTPAVPSVLITDEYEDGHVRSVRLTVAQTTASLTCSIAAPTTAGYALAWQDYSGSWLSVYSEMVQKVKSYPFASATDFGGPDLQPPLRGLAQFGTNYGVLLAKSHAVELWRLDGFGVRQPGALVFPSLVGNLGEVSAVMAGSALAVTYADYTDTARTAGRRLFVKAACY